ncbi:MAG: ribose 1,5-bisphosphate isomerase [Methanomassiliicoccaceae archaeon]|jgi:ribose 1,5-bisphosphate isomerase|nr:ribose 1,5-bisphosphate isomerase [Methanomassiliicoccaceae archaeon]
MNVDETVRAIKSMEIRGAGRIARAAAATLGELAVSKDWKSISEMRRDILNAKKELISSRPTAVSLMNGVQSTLKGFNECGTVKDAKALIIKNSEDFIKASNEAVTKIGIIGSRRIKDGAVIMTHCNSSAALECIKAAHRSGKKIKVYATESRPWRQGILTVNELAKEGIDVTLIIDGAVRSVMKKVDIVMVGADTITSNGAVINKIGTSQLALAANESHVPFVVCGETYKISPQSLFGDMVTIEERDIGEIVKKGEISGNVKVFNPVFDSTPAKYIDAIVTEAGIISPGSVYEIMMRQFGDITFE